MRLFVSEALVDGAELSLPAGAARHAQVRRVQPGDCVVLFDGTSGCDWPAQVLAVGRSEVRVRLGAPAAVDRELVQRVTVALAMPANERMDTVVEKAAELGAARIRPLVSERSVLRLDGERAARKVAHWQAVAVSACEQCGRARVPVVEPVMPLAAWLAALPAAADGGELRLVQSLQPDAGALRDAGAACAGAREVVLLSGPEGGLAADEEAAARRAGFAPVALGPRVLRADTAPLAVLAWIGLQAQPG